MTPNAATIRFYRLATTVDFPRVLGIVSFFLVKEVHGPVGSVGPEQSLGDLSASVSRLIALRVPPSKILPVFEWYVLA